MWKLRNGLRGSRAECASRENLQCPATRLAVVNYQRAGDCDSPEAKAKFFELAREYADLALRLDDPTGWSAKHARRIGSSLRTRLRRRFVGRRSRINFRCLPSLPGPAPAKRIRGLRETEPRTSNVPGSFSRSLAQRVLVQVRNILRARLQHHLAPSQRSACACGSMSASR
jgi:hypothetical protein